MLILIIKFQMPINSLNYVFTSMAEKQNKIKNMIFITSHNRMIKPSS